VPIDTNPALGTITTTLNFAGPTFENMVGHYIYRLSSPAQHFSSITATFIVTNANTGQSLSGIIYSNGISPLPYGMVLALTTTADDNYSAAAMADSSGHYQLNISPGSYSLYGAFPGYYFDQSLIPAVTLTDGMDATNNLSLTNGTAAISGTVFGCTGTTTNTAGGVLLQFSSGNLTAFAFTDTNGNYSAGVSPNNWKVKIHEERLARRAYVAWETTPQVNTTTNSVANVTNIVFQGNSLFYGRITSNSGTALANVEIGGGDFDNLYGSKGFSDQNGNYAAVVLGNITNDAWYPSVEGNVALLSYIVNAVDYTNIAVNQTRQQNFDCLPVTAQISGQVQAQFFGPIAGLQLYASATINNLNYNSVKVTTDPSGDYVLDVASGDWQVGFDSNGSGSPGSLGLIDLNGPYFVTIPPTNATLNLTLYTNSTPVLTQPLRLSPTQFGFNVTGLLNVNYIVQVSTNLASTNWSDLQSFQLTTNPFPIVDVQATNSPRFYRVLENQ
jgi:hypothetical protein